jgi:hypothetical protein
MLSLSHTHPHTHTHTHIYIYISVLFFLVLWSGVRLSPLGTSANIWSTVPAPYDDDDDDDDDDEWINR